MTDRSATASAVLPSPRRTVLPGEGADWTPPSWDDVVREHADRVYRLAYRLTGNPHDAEDLTQETFIRVFRSLADYKPGTFEGWLHRITTNLFLDMVRRRARLRMEGLPEDSDRLPGAGPEPEQVFSDTHLDPVLQAALDELAPEFRAAVVLCDVEGLSYEEIGATLGVKLGTVRSRIHRGRAALRAALERRGAAARGGHDEGRSGGRGMTGARRFSLSSPDWGQAHLTLDAIVAYVDDELSPGARRARAGAPRRLRRVPRRGRRPASGPRRPCAARWPEPAVVAAAQPAVDPGRGRAAPDAARSRRHRGRAVRPAARRPAGRSRCRPDAHEPRSRRPCPTCPRPASVPARPRRRGGSPAGRGSARCRAWRWARWPSARWPRPGAARRSPWPPSGVARWCRRWTGAAPARPAVERTPPPARSSRRRRTPRRPAPWRPGGPRRAAARPPEPHPRCLPPGALSPRQLPPRSAHPIGYADFTAAAAG